MPWYKIQDKLEETRLARTGAAFGSIRRGIAYAYSDKYLKIPSTGISFLYFYSANYSFYLFLHQERKAYLYVRSTFRCINDFVQKVLSSTNEQVGNRPAH